jgi:hypothetical protein
VRSKRLEAGDLGATSSKLSSSEKTQRGEEERARRRGGGKVVGREIGKTKGRSRIRYYTRIELLSLSVKIGPLPAKGERGGIGDGWL